MKVLHVSYGHYPGYAAPYEYTQCLAAEGVEVHVIALSRPGESAVEEINGVQVTRIPLTPKKRFSLGNSMTLIRQVHALIGKQSFDVIHVYAFRGCGVLPLVSRVDSTRWLLDIRTGNTSSRASFANWVTRLESKAYDHCIALDRKVGQQVLGVHCRFDVVPLGVNLGAFQPGNNRMMRRQLGLPEDVILAVFSGRFDNPLRMPERLLYGFAKAHKLYNQLHLLIIGGGTYLENLKHLAKELEIAKQVTFTGRVPYTEMNAMLQAADIGLGYVPIIPQFNYQPPLKTVEFLAAGLPTVATATDGNRRFIQHEENGLLVLDTPEALAAGIVRLARCRALREHLAKNARGSVEEYDWCTIVRDRLLPIYQRIVAR